MEIDNENLLDDTAAMLETMALLACEIVHTGGYDNHFTVAKAHAIECLARQACKMLQHAPRPALQGEA